MRTSRKGIDTIKRAEDEPGFLAGRCSRLTAYQCAAGVWTCGWGTTRNVVEGMRITPEMADRLLLEDIERIEADLERTLKVEVTQGQWDALVSLAYNLAGGAPAIPRKAPKLWAKLHAGDVAGAADEFLDITGAAGKKLAGLERRRREERGMFLGA